MNGGAWLLGLGSGSRWFSDDCLCFMVVDLHCGWDCGSSGVLVAGGILTGVPVLHDGKPLRPAQLLPYIRWDVIIAVGSITILFVVVGSASSASISALTTLTATATTASTASPAVIAVSTMALVVLGMLVYLPLGLVELLVLLVQSLGKVMENLVINCILPLDGGSTRSRGGSTSIPRTTKAMEEAATTAGEVVEAMEAMAVKVVTVEMVAEEAEATTTKRMVMEPTAMITSHLMYGRNSAGLRDLPS